MADAGYYPDCCRRWWLGPRARLRITQGPGEAGLLPHTPEAGVPPASHAGLPKLSSLSAACTHAGLLFHPRAPLREQLAGPPGASGGGEWDWVSRCWLTCSPWAPHSCGRMRALGPRLLGTFHLRETRQALVSQEQSHQPFAGRLALQTEQPYR